MTSTATRTSRKSPEARRSPRRARQLRARHAAGPRAGRRRGRARRVAGPDAAGGSPSASGSGRCCAAHAAGSQGRPRCEAGAGGRAVARRSPGRGPQRPHASRRAPTPPGRAGRGDLRVGRGRACAPSGDGLCVPTSIERASDCREPPRAKPREPACAVRLRRRRYRDPRRAAGCDPPRAACLQSERARGAAVRMTTTALGPTRLPPCGGVATIAAPVTNAAPTRENAPAIRAILGVRVRIGRRRRSSEFEFSPHWRSRVTPTTAVNAHRPGRMQSEGLAETQEARKEACAEDAQGATHRKARRRETCQPRARRLTSAP